MSSWTLPVGALDIQFMPKVDLDPLLLRYWENFPCPPPWNNGLLQQMNWTSCHGDEDVGAVLRDMMVEKCATYLNVRVVAKEVGRADFFQSCGIECKVIISAACLFLGVLSIIVISAFRHRKRRRKSDFSPTHQTALNSTTDRKYYTSCMQGNSPVIKKKGKKDSGMDIMLLDRENFQNIYTSPESMSAEQLVVDQEYHDTLNQQLMNIAKMAENQFSNSLKKRKSETNWTFCDNLPGTSSRDGMTNSQSSDRGKITNRLSRDSSLFSNDSIKGSAFRLSRDSSVFTPELLKKDATYESIPSTSRASVYCDPVDIRTVSQDSDADEYETEASFDRKTNMAEASSSDTFSKNDFSVRFDSSDDLDTKLFIKN
ncbi:uncharacterized protein LOC126821978 [Patella vulgata]|uniref:uncharacterized protein LOC126821978 n=1 Tax=Patella vulgata TaxID=6465 RepID=UPI00217F6F4C|nr:uncharacterized protein LOC126821978 [Patella vulgata]XP_050406622.1 uncharacterized protein LOC126821978 [Patella vulgata]